MTTAVTVNMVHVSTGSSFQLRVPNGMGLIGVVKKRIGKNARIDAPNDIIVFQDNCHCSKHDAVEHLQVQDDFVVLRYIMKSDFEAEASDPVRADIGSSSPVPVVAEDASSSSEDEEVYEETDFASSAVRASEAVIPLEPVAMYSADTTASTRNPEAPICLI